MIATIIGYVIGILGAIGIFWGGYEVGKIMGMRKAETLFDEAVEKIWRRNNDCP